jgi:hypothetical protein
MIATVPALLPPRDRRHVGIAATVLVHIALILGWQMTRHAPSVGPAPQRTTIQWIRLPAPAAPQPRRANEEQEPVRPQVAPRAAAITLPRVIVPAPPAVAPTTGTPTAANTPAPSATPAAPATGATMLEQARRDVGAIDRALRKENNPYIVAPPDSPQIRLRKGIQAAADMAPNAHDEHRHDREARQDEDHQLPGARIDGQCAGMAHGARLTSLARHAHDWLCHRNVIEMGEPDVALFRVAFSEADPLSRGHPCSCSPSPSRPPFART